MEGNVALVPGSGPGAPAGDKLAPQGGLQLIHDAGGKQWFLRDPRTCEIGIVIQPPHNEEWDLDFSEEGWAIVFSDSEQHWANTFLQHDVYESADGKVYAKHRETHVSRFVDDMLASHQEFTADALGKTLRAVVFDRWQGARVWVSFQDLYGIMQLSGCGGDSTDWVNRKMKSFVTFLGSLNMHEPHVRRSLACAPTSASSQSRVLPYTTFSSHATVALLGNMAHGMRNFGGLLNGEEKKAQHVLHFLLGETSAEYTLRLNADLSSKHIGRVNVGAAPIKLRVKDGIINLQPLRADLMIRESTMYHLISASCVDPNTFCVDEGMLVSDFFILVLSKGPRLHWLASQVAYQLGDLVDERLVAIVRPPVVDLTGPLASTHSGGQLKLARNRGISDTHWRQRKQALYRYYMAGRECFGDCATLSTAVDGARLAKKKIFLALIAKSSNEAMWAPPQVCPDFAATVTARPGDAVREHDDWKSRARAFLKRTARDDAEAMPAKKKFRVASMQWLAGLHNSLQTSTGRGLERFVLRLDGDGAHHPLCHPYLSVASDQGSDGLCATAYAQFGPLSCVIDRVDDPSHGVTNDLDLAIAAAGLKPHQLLMNVARNTVHGPFDEGRRFVETAEGIREYCDLTNGWECPVFNALLPAILEDRGKGESVTDPGIQETMFSELRDSQVWTKKPQKTSTSRFCGVVYRAREGEEYWTFTYIGFLYVCLQTGAYSPERVAETFNIKAVIKTPSGQVSDEPTTRCATDIPGLRALTKNQLELATIVFGDVENKYRQRLIRHLADPVVNWHGQQNKILRTCDATVKWEIQQIDCDFFKSLASVLKKLSDAATLEACGLITDVVRGAPADVFLAHPVVAWNSEQANMMAVFAMSLVLVRVQRCLPLLRGWPRRCVLGLKPSFGQVMVDEFKRDFELFTALQEKNDTFSKALVRASPFSSTPVRTYVAAFKATGWQFNGEIRHLLRERHTRVIATQANEDGFGSERREETKAANYLIAADRMWSTLIQKRVLTQKHHYEEINYHTIPRTRNVNIPRSFYREPRRKGAVAPSTESEIMSQKLKGVVGFNSTPKWNSPGTTTISKNAAELVMIEQGAAQGRGDLRSSWLSCLAPTGSVILRNRAAGGQWYMSLGNVNSVIAVGWPVFEQGSSSEPMCGPGYAYTFGAPKADFKDHLFTIFDATDWEAVPVKFESPLELHLRGFAMPGDCPCALVAARTGPTESLLHVAARAAFWQLSLPVLRKIARHYKYEVDETGSLYRTLWDLVECILKCSDAELVEILSQRTFKFDFNVDEFIQLEGVEESMTRDEKETFHQTLARTKSHQSEVESFWVELRKERRKLNKVSDKVALNPNGAKSLFHKYTGPRAFPPEVPSQQEAKRLMPPGAYLWRAYSSPGSWCAHFKPYPRTSVPFSVKGGVHQALRIVVQRMWRLYLGHHGFDESACIIKGLFTEETPLMVGASSSSSSIPVGGK